MSSYEGRGRGNVDARFEEATNHVNIGPERVVGDAIRGEGEKCIDVVCGENADRI